MAKNLDIRSLSILIKKNVEGFGLQSPDGPEESCIAALIHAYFCEKGPKPPENFFVTFSKEMKYAFFFLRKNFVKILLNV